MCDFRDQRQGLLLIVTYVDDCILPEVETQSWFRSTCRYRLPLVWISYDFTRHLDRLSQRASEEEISGETGPMPFLWGDLAPVLWKLQAAFDQFMYLCISTCFGLKTMPGKKRGVHYVYRILGVILSANFCARWVVPAFERKFLFLSSSAKFIACGIWEVPFWDGVYGSPRTQDSISWLPYVTHMCLSDRLWKGMTLQLKQGQGSENLLLEYVELTMRRQGRDGHVKRSHVWMPRFPVGIPLLLLGYPTF